MDPDTHYWRPLPVGCGEAAFKLRLAGDPDVINNVIGLDFDTAPTVATANAIFNAWTTRIGPVTSTTITLEGVHILFQSDSSMQTAVDSTNTAVVGTRTTSTSVLPPNCTYLVRKRTGFAGKRNRGRLYHPGVRETDADNVGAISGADVTTMQTAFTAWFGDLAPHNPCIIHSVLCTAGATGHSGPHSGAPLPPTPILSFEVDDRIGTQRRRLNR